MTKQTILTIDQQTHFIMKHWRYETFKLKWSNRGNGVFTVFDRFDNKLSCARGHGYDRTGSALGDAFNAIFKDEILKLARKTCKGRKRKYKTSSDYHGLIYNAANDTARIDGAHGEECVKAILLKIGFGLKLVGESSKTNHGEAFYELSPITKEQRKYLK